MNRDDGFRILKESWYLVVFALILLTVLIWNIVFNKPSSNGEVSNCIIESAVPAQAYGLPDQVIQCKSEVYGLVTVTAPKNVTYNIGDNVQVVGVYGDKLGVSYHIAE